MFTKDMHIADLIDIYGALLSESKKNIIEMYYADDYSLSEIASITGISRQGVRDSIKKSEIELIDYENRLHLMEKSAQNSELITQIIDLLTRSEHPEEVEEALKLLKSISF